MQIVRGDVPLKMDSRAGGLKPPFGVGGQLALAGDKIVVACQARFAINQHRFGLGVQMIDQFQRQVWLDHGKIDALPGGDLGDDRPGDEHAKLQLGHGAQDILRLAPAAAGAGHDHGARALGGGDGGTVGVTDLAALVQKRAVKVDAD